MDNEPSTSSVIKRSLPNDLQNDVDAIAAKRSRVIVEPADLDDNQKRWLFVGICLHSVISPALRKFIVPVLTKLCYQLSIQYRIDTQTYQGRLRKYPPTNAILNYEAVNNNKCAFGNQFSKYDYTIKNVVDLSKLFLQTHMAHYTGFNETCDSSALLGLIINIDQFPLVVKLDAGEVRQDVRNRWAHCDFTEWNAIKYATSFQKMEKLVMDLNLSLNDENQIIVEINKWKENGQLYLSGTTFGFELVNEIRQQTQNLAKYSQLVVAETDKCLLEIKKELENCEKVFGNKLNELKKNNEREFCELNEKMKAHDENLKSQQTQIEKVEEELYHGSGKGEDFHNAEMDEWKELEVMFVETPIVNEISLNLESKNCVLIVGEPGIGKSMLVRHVALKLHCMMGYTIIPCSDFEAVRNHYKVDKKQIFVMDDIFGRYTASFSDIEYLMRKETIFRKILKTGRAKIAATCRTDIYRDEHFQGFCTFFNSNIFNLSTSYSREDKLKISTKYLSEANIQLLKNQNVDFTPLMCYLYSKNENFNLTDFLKCPFEQFQDEWNKLKSIHSYKYCALFLCVIYNGIIKESSLNICDEKSTKNKHALENIFETCGINPCPSRRTIKAVLDSIIGTYLRKIGNRYIVIHDHMFDFMCCYFGNKDENDMVIGILRDSDIGVFNQRIQLKSIDEQHGKFTIMISHENEKEYFERIKKDLQLGKLDQCFRNSQMKHEKYRASLLRILESLDDNLLIKEVYKIINWQYDNNNAEDYPYDDIVYNDNDVMDDYELFLLSGVFISACYRGYLNIVKYFISKGANIKTKDSLNSPLTAACSGGNEKLVQFLICKGSNVNQSYSRTPLTAACTRGRYKIVQLLIENGCNVNLTDDIGIIPLIAACKKGNQAIVQLLIEKGSDINQIDVYGNSPFTAACGEGHAKIAQLLIDNGCDFNCYGCSRPPLFDACVIGNEQIVQLLIEKGHDVNKSISWSGTPLTGACERGNEKIVRLLLDKGSIVNMANMSGETPMTVACTKGYETIVQLLMDNGSNAIKASDERQTPLIAACEEGNERIVHLLIDNGYDVNQSNEDKETPLSAACNKGNEKIVRSLIDKVYDVNVTDRNGYTPLTLACLNNNDNIIQLLIERGCDVNSHVRKIWTPLIAACSKANEKIVQLLIDTGCDVNNVGVWNQTPLLAAIKVRNERIVQLLINSGCNINQADQCGRIPLIEACENGDENIVQFLIDEECNLNCVDSYGLTPLIAACQRGNIKIVQLLINKKCNVSQTDGYKLTHLTAACNKGSVEIVQFFIDRGWNVDCAGFRGPTPLIAACLVGSMRIVQLLLNKECNVNKPDGLGRTSLTAACRGGNEKIVQLFIDRGCDVKLSDNMGQTPLTAACSNHCVAIVQLLLEHGSDVNQIDGKGWTPLTSACDSGYLMIVKILIEKGSDVNQIDGKGRTPLSFGFCDSFNEEIVKILIDKGCNVNKAFKLNEQSRLFRFYSRFYKYKEVTPLEMAYEHNNKQTIKLLLQKGADYSKVRRVFFSLDYS